MTDLGATTEFLVLDGFFKAMPLEEGGQRLVYLQASNEAVDYQNEVVMAKALADSADYFLRFGNLDIDHLTQTGPKRGVPGFAAFEIGRPVDVKVSGTETWVKGLIAQGDAPAATEANLFWDSITKVSPPQRWYPSVGGAIDPAGRSTIIDPVTKQKRTLIKSVRWTNIGFSKTPVNLDVPTVSTVPFGALAKSWSPDGLDLTKALEAGYGTDAATLTGGAALRAQSADPKIQNYWEFRERLAGDLRRRRVGSTPRELVKHASTAMGMPEGQAGEWTERFLMDLSARRNLERVK